MWRRSEMFFNIILCRGTDSNRHELLGSQVFETCVSTIPPPRLVALIISRRRGVLKFEPEQGKQEEIYEVKWWSV